MSKSLYEITLDEWRKMMPGTINKEQEREKEKKEDDFSMDLILPDTKSILGELDKAFLDVLKQEHIEAMAEEEKNEKKDGKKRAKKPGGTICCCKVDGCRIGPFIQMD